MTKRVVLLALFLVLVGDATMAQLQPHAINFTLANTGAGVNDGRLRFALDSYPVPGEDYFIDNVSLVCGGGQIIQNGTFAAAGASWITFTNAPIPKPTFSFGGGQAKISFGSDGTNTQMFQRDLVLPAAGTPCRLQFDACSTSGNNLDVKLIRHTGPPYSNYGVNQNGVDIQVCGATGPVCGNNVTEGNEQCDEGGVNTSTCDGDCTTPVCGDGLVNAAANEQCDDGNTTAGDGCSPTCLIEPFCGDGVVDSPNASGQFEDCDNGGGTPANQQTGQTSSCDSDCTFAACGDGTLNTAAGEQCDDGNLTNGDGCDSNCNPEGGFDCEINYGQMTGDALWLYGRNICDQPTVQIGQVGGIPVDVSGGITSSNSQEIHVDLSSFGLVFQDDTFCKVIIRCPFDIVKEIDVSLPSTGPTGPTGPAGQDGQDGAQGPQGKIGPTGDAGQDGSDGAQGPQGKIGPTGMKGVTGSTGPTGSDGAQGSQGKIGPTGDSGTPGSDGSDGAQGPQGKIGPTGMKGVTGSTGPTGSDGAQGSQGKIGPTGDSGTPGQDGSDGAQGPQGKIGPTGMKGVTGSTGPTGSDGAQGSQGKIGPTGDSGTPGQDGSDGAQGPQGKMGPTGMKGVTGSTGPAGDDGAQGSQGKIGPTGETGTPGTPGTDGTQGPQGKIGPTGMKGVTGSTGPTGSDGAQGSQGKIGPTGETGTPGTPGTDGTQGPQGKIGPTGMKGAAGTNGADGSTGPTGPGGATGPSTTTVTPGVNVCAAGKEVSGCGCECTAPGFHLNFCTKGVGESCVGQCSDAAGTPGQVTVTAFCVP